MNIEKKKQTLLDSLRIPVIGAPLFIVSNPKLVIEQCKAGIIGSFPALNARTEEDLEKWMIEINEELENYKKKEPNKKIAPYAVNQIVHQSNTRLRHDVEMCVKYKAPIVITSLRPPGEVVEAVHSYGGLVFHDVINMKHAKRAISEGVDGIIAVCGNANTNELNTSVIPFMLRGIKLWGMDSANCSIKRREFIWGEAANLVDFSLLEKSIQTVSLEELVETYPKILKGEISGRVLVDLNK